MHGSERAAWCAVFSLLLASKETENKRIALGLDVEETLAGFTAFLEVSAFAP